MCIYLPYAILIKPSVCYTSLMFAQLTIRSL